MKIDQKTVLTFIAGALVAYAYNFVVTNLQIAKIQGKVEVFSQYCKPQLEQTGITK